MIFYEMLQPDGAARGAYDNAQSWLTVARTFWRLGVSLIESLCRTFQGRECPTDRFVLRRNTTSNKRFRNLLRPGIYRPPGRVRPGRVRRGFFKSCLG